MFYFLEGVYMNDVTKVLLNVRSLRAATKELELEQLEDILVKLTDIVVNKREAVEIELAEREEKQAKMNDILAQLQESGINPEDLIALKEQSQTKTKIKPKREPRPAKYIYELEGVMKTWTGQGRMPLTLQNAKNETGSIEQFLI